MNEEVTNDVDLPIWLNYIETLHQAEIALDVRAFESFSYRNALYQNYSQWIAPVDPNFKPRLSYGRYMLMHAFTYINHCCLIGEEELNQEAQCLFQVMHSRRESEQDAVVIKSSNNLVTDLLSATARMKSLELAAIISQLLSAYQFPLALLVRFKLIDVAIKAILVRRPDLEERLYIGSRSNGVSHWTECVLPVVTMDVFADLDTMVDALARIATDEDPIYP